MKDSISCRSGTLALFAMTILINAEPRELVVGIICGEYCDVPRETIHVNISCAALTYYRTDNASSYHVFEIVRELDNNPSVDVIIFMDNSTTILEKKVPLYAKNKPLIIWGDVPENSQPSKIQTATVMKPSNCRYAYYQKKPEDLMCVDNSKARYAKTDISPRTLYSGPIIISSLMKYLEWKYVIVIYEDATVFEMSTLLNLMSKQKIMCSLFHVNDLDRLWSDLATKKDIYYFTLKEEASLYFAVLCRQDCARRVLKEGNNYDSFYNSNRTTLRSLSRWIFAMYGEDYDFLKYCGPDMDHVLVVPVPELRLDRQNMLLSTLKTIMQSSVESNCLSKKNFISKITKISLEINVRCENYHMSTLAWTTRGRQFIPVGYIQSDGQGYITSDLFPNAKYGYNRRMFKVSVILYPPFVIRNVINGTVQYSGFCIDILLELANVLNFTCHISEVPDGNYGVVLDRKTMKFNGLIGQVQRNEVDMIVGDIAISKDREQVMDFTFPFYYGFTTVIFKRPNADAYRWRKLADPLKWQVVVIVIAALCLSSLIVCLLERHNPYYEATLKSESVGHHCRRYMCGLQSFYGSLSFLFSILLNEGNASNHEPRSFTGRTFFSCWCLFSLVVVGTYSGNLIASLTVTKEVKPFDSLSELAKLSESYKWGTIGGSLWEEVLLTSDIPSYKGIGDGMRRFNKTDQGVLNKNHAYHMNRVKNEDNYAFIADDGSVEIALGKDCRLSKIKERFLTLMEAFGFPDKSPHVRVFAEKYKLMHMHDSGIIKHLKRKWWRSNKTCTNQITRGAKPIEVLDVQAAFYIAAAGVTFAMLAFGAENIIFKVRQGMKT